MNHLDVWRNEAHQNALEQRWLTWAKQVEQRLGHSLNGDEEEDGYSIDGALSAFEHGRTVEQYTRSVIQAEISLAVAADG